MAFSISSSITDFPLTASMETFFKELKFAGVDSVEIVSGLKSRLRLAKVFELSKNYNLPIASFHQSAWSGTGIYFDEYFLAKASDLGVKTFVFHPLTFTSMHSKRMEKYVKRLGVMQREYGITICLENMKAESAYKNLYLKGQSVSTHLDHLYQIAKEYGLSLTYDVSHARFVRPHQEASFKQIFPLLGNIHLSSFHKESEHLPLFMGDFDTQEFIQYLLKNNYNGLLTLEIFYPKMISLANYDFSAIAKSVKIIKEVTCKS